MFTPADPCIPTFAKMVEIRLCLVSYVYHRNFNDFQQTLQSSLFATVCSSRVSRFRAVR